MFKNNKTYYSEYRWSGTNQTSDGETNTHEIYVESYHGWFSIINSYSFYVSN